MTGKHFVKDVYCKKCNRKHGWFYESAAEEKQKYKEGKTVLEKVLLQEVAVKVTEWTNTTELMDLTNAKISDDTEMEADSNSESPKSSKTKEEKFVVAYFEEVKQSPLEAMKCIQNTYAADLRNDANFALKNDANFIELNEQIAKIQQRFRKREASDSMMPVLNREILFAIGKKLVEDGDSGDVLKFALSGKQNLQEMKNVFASVSTVEIGKKCCTFGWDDPCCKFEFRNDKQCFKFLMHCIGNSVADLRVKCSTFVDTHQTAYNPILNKMLVRKQLRSFSLLVDGYAVRKFFGEFLVQFSSTLKNVKIPSAFMTRTFRDSFNLDSVIVLDSGNKNLLLLCCKTTSLSYDGELPLLIFDRFIRKNLQLSTPLFSIKKLIFRPQYFFSQAFNFVRLPDLMKYFPELEYVKFNNPLYHIYVRQLIRSYTEVLNGSIKAPPKVVVEFFKPNQNGECPTLDSYKADYLDNSYKYDEAVYAFFCFRKNVQMAGSDATTVFEVLFPKE